jgi:hypothetical protein
VQAFLVVSTNVILQFSNFILIHRNKILNNQEQGGRLNFSELFFEGVNACRTPFKSMYHFINFDA